MTVITRRTALAGAAATTAATAVGAANVPAPARADARADMDAFLDISAALTGIAKDKLAPAPDPIDIKLVYFDKARDNPKFNDLLKIWRGPPQASSASVFFDQPDAGVRYLARNIIIAWYLGAWCDPADLKKYAANPPPTPLPYTILSPAAYTQGWAWRVAQAHPMGYSELRFGYWSNQPFALSDLIGGT
jgi:Membrane bound FAD containing D-sorbitol dehydrogenase